MEHKKKHLFGYCRGGGGLQMEERFAGTSVLSSGEKGLCGSELDWLSTAVSVEENSRLELNNRRRKAGGERCVSNRKGAETCLASVAGRASLACTVDIVTTGIDACSIEEARVGYAWVHRCLHK